MTSLHLNVSEMTVRGQRLIEAQEPGLSTRVGSRLAELDSGLDTKSCVMLTALTVMDDAPGRLELHICNALDVSVTQSELLEIVIRWRRTRARQSE